MMKRTVLLMLILVALFCVPVRAADSLSFFCAYVPASASDETFSIEVSCSDKASAAVLSLSYDGAKVAYQGAEAVSGTSTVRDHPTGGRVTVCIADSGSVKKLCRLRFKPLAAGETRFTLLAEQAADSRARLVTDLTGASLTVNLPKKKAAAARTSSGSDKRNSKSTSSRGSNGSSSIRKRSESEEKADDLPDRRGGTFDLRRAREPRYSWMGTAILIPALIALGAFIRKKPTAEKAQSPPEEGAEPPQPAELTPEEMQAIISELNDEIKPKP